MHEKFITGEQLREQFYDKERSRIKTEVNRLFKEEARKMASGRVHEQAKKQVDPIRENSNYVIAASSFLMFCAVATRSGVAAGLIAGTLTALATKFYLPKALDMLQDYIEQSAEVVIHPF